MMHDLPFDLVELVPCPAVSLPAPGIPLRETAYHRGGWLPDDIDRLRTLFAADDGLQEIADALGRTLSAVRTKVDDLGLRRNSSRSWTEMDDAHLVARYGTDATSAIAGALGRSAGAIYARARLLDLTEATEPIWTQWEIAQVRTGYERGVPVAQLGVLIGRTPSAVATLASKFKIEHANAPRDWSDARAAACARTGGRRLPLYRDRRAAQGCRPPPAPGPDGRPDAAPARLCARLGTPLAGRGG